MLSKRNIAVVWGGYSSEAEVSKRSMQGICSFLDKQRYNIYPVQITKDKWEAQLPNGDSALIDKNDFSLKTKPEKIKIDFAYITIHGTPGEDGRLQGYFDMIQVPYSSSGAFTSALTFDKFTCNHFLKNFQIQVAKSMLVKKEDDIQIESVIHSLGLPLFVKPSAGGSSFASSKVKTATELPLAIQEALLESDTVIVEQFIDGQEFTCGCYEVGGQMHVLPVTEIISENEFFDYAAKYQGKSQEITPARISDRKTALIQEKTAYIYKLIGARGLIRVDYIDTQDALYMLEINTTPGMTATSFIPQQVSAYGTTMTDVLTQIIEDQIKNSTTTL